MSASFNAGRRWFVSALAIGALLAIGSAEAADRIASANEVTSDDEPREVVVIDVHLGEATGVRSALDGLGATVVSYLGPRRWLVVGDSGAIGRVTGIASAAPWRTADAISADLPALAVAAKKAGRREVSVLAALAPGAGLTGVGRRLEAAGARIAWLEEAAAPAPQIGLRIPTDRLDEVLDELRKTAGLILAEPQAPVRLFNSGSVWRCQSGVPDSTPIFDHGLRGEGQIIGIMDTGLDIDDCRFDDPLVGLPALNGPDGTDVDLEHRKVL
ncbi:MAG: hypothetical protein AB1Z65_11945, partial [Candidatus Sulfomarinibacteraceae bacterium]